MREWGSHKGEGSAARSEESGAINSREAGSHMIQRLREFIDWTPLTTMDKPSRWKVNKETSALNDTLRPDGLNRTFHPKAAEYTFFSNAYGTLLRIDHILGHKTKLNKHKKTEIISNIFFNHNSMKLKINYKTKLEKSRIC